MRGPAAVGGPGGMQGGPSRVTAMCAGSTKSQVVADGMKPSVTLAAFTELGLTILPSTVTSLEAAIGDHLTTEVLTSYRVMPRPRPRPPAHPPPPPPPSPPLWTFKCQCTPGVKLPVSVSFAPRAACPIAARAMQMPLQARTDAGIASNTARSHYAPACRCPCGVHRSGSSLWAKELNPRAP